MPTVVCPRCRFSVLYLDDLIGSLQCPSCGEEILQGSASPARRQDRPEPGVPLFAPADDEEAAEKGPPRRAEPDRRSRDVDEPDQRSPMTQPAGVRWAGTTWFVCGIFGLIVNGLVVVFLWVAAGFALGQRAEAPPMPGQETPLLLVLLPLIVLTVGTLLLYPGLIWIGSRLRAGSWRALTVPAGFVLGIALWLFLANAGFVAGVATALAQEAHPDGQVDRFTGHMSLGMGLLFLAFSVPFLFVDLFLIRSSQLLLWQSAQQAHWFNAGLAKPKLAPLRERTPYPASIGLAGFLWVLLGLVGIGFNLWQAAQYVLANHQDSTATRGIVLFGLGLGVLMSILTAIYLGVLLLGGRLSSTGPAGIALLICCLLSLGVQGCVYLKLDFLLDLLAQHAGSLPSAIRESLRNGFLVSAGLTGVAIVAAVACIVGNGAYRSWLRTWRGLQV